MPTGLHGRVISSDQTISIEVLAKRGQNNVAENDEATIFWSRDVIGDRNNIIFTYRSDGRLVNRM
jgi:hypothetical protein